MRTVIMVRIMYIMLNLIRRPFRSVFYSGQPADKQHRWW